MSENGDGEKQEKPPQMPLPGMAYEPSKKDRLRPAELLIFSGVLSVFVALIVLLSTREWWLAGIAVLVSFIIVLVVLALFSLSFKPKDDEQDEIHEQDEKNEGH